MLKHLNIENTFVVIKMFGIEEIEKYVHESGLYESDKTLAELIDNASKMIEDFELWLAWFSHDVKDISTSLNDGVTLVEKYRRLTYKDFFNNVKAHAEYLQSLCDLLRDMRASSSRKFKKGACAIYPVVAGVVSALTFRAIKRGITVRNWIEEIPERKVALPHYELFSVFANLLGNAIKYTRENGKIEIGIEDHDMFYQLNVWDNGFGIRPEDRERVFERSVRLVDDIPGKGLGLYFVKEIVEHYGREAGLEGELIWVDSKTEEETGEGSYTNFVFRVPRAYI